MMISQPLPDTQIIQGMQVSLNNHKLLANCYSRCFLQKYRYCSFISVQNNTLNSELSWCLARIIDGRSMKSCEWVQKKWT
ncbi:uncharacterized protein LOC119656284 isoform X2 [Hermetia illucens]|uniref:uncharacterized protein LOC119656284 isoform X2 n=1 Tax=Hermetia illucens TaxID=343691 RepID=UPI0018CC5E63|nr:uncharacterized protein LOC119656284 isoform X2 [Hermetia illucens]